MFANPPTGWGEDPLSDFVTRALNNIFATQDQRPEDYGRLVEIDRVFRTLLENLNHTDEWFAGFFVLQSHSAFLGAARLAMSGQLSETYVLLRSCLEHALYGLYLSAHPGQVSTWLERHKDEASRKKARRHFEMRVLFEHLRAVDPRRYETVKLLYERTIDYGAHPNPRALFSALEQEEAEGTIHFQRLYLVGDDEPLHLCLKSTAQVGVGSLEVFRNIYRTRYELVGIEPRLGELRSVL
jgi:hypothetical protein